MSTNNPTPTPAPTSTSHIKTRLLILSDTHTATPATHQDAAVAVNADVPFRSPLPTADVALHCGDLTMLGLLHEYETTLSMLSSLSAELKLVIAGNHDVSLDVEYYARKGEYMHTRNGNEPYDPDKPRKARELWTGERARAAGIMYLEEGVHEFRLGNGARLRIYASPYQPEFCDWAFPYWRNQDRYNPPHQCTPNSAPIADNPVPDFPNIDVMMTHGPPLGIRDTTRDGDHVGCQHLLRAARRCKPLVHCFGHIHEAWGAERVRWKEGDDLDEGEHVEEARLVHVDWEQMNQQKGAFLDLTQESGQALEFGRETLMVNASIMSIRYRPSQGPWVIDLALQKAT